MTVDASTELEAPEPGDTSMSGDQLRKCVWNAMRG
jgi:hypothetical protein